MAQDDLNTAQDAAVGVGPSPSNNSTDTPDNAPVPGPGPGPYPHPDIATPGAADAPSSSSPIQNSTITTRASSPPPPSIPIESTETTAATTTASTTNETESSAPEASAAPTASPQAVVQNSTSASQSPATVAAPASPSQPQQNGDSKAPEADSEMASYRPAFTAHHGLAVSYSTTTPPTLASSGHLATSLPPATSAYAPSTAIANAQHASYSANTGASHLNEGYRVSPVPSNNPMSLPSMRTIDAMSQRVSPPYGPHHHPVSMSMNGPLTPVSSSPSYYTTQHTMPVPSNYALPSDSLARYPLPHDPRILGSRGPKKVLGPMLHPVSDPLAIGRGRLCTYMMSFERWNFFIVERIVNQWRTCRKLNGERKRGV